MPCLLRGATAHQCSSSSHAVDPPAQKRHCADEFLLQGWPVRRDLGSMQQLGPPVHASDFAAVDHRGICPAAQQTHRQLHHLGAVLALCLQQQCHRLTITPWRGVCLLQLLLTCQPSPCQLEMQDFAFMLLGRLLVAGVSPASCCIHAPNLAEHHQLACEIPQ